ncbi:hypothetical protein GH714_008280 [Hevea brasiliensis]|uniref:Kinesin motor domain-containing protein n=1 Tax=Hevea brasiliensis TaxID=3981 RepID=A0A6A6LWK6_HEVBR|nr:hypothetical protein GH714_008280 [Hevea brasiliensis]
MLRDFKFLRRNSGKQSEEIENVPVNPRYSLASQARADSSRPPLNTIQVPAPILHPPNPKFEQEAVTARSKIDRTPAKPKPKNCDSTLPPDKYGGVGFHTKNQLGWTQGNGPSSTPSDSRDEMRPDINNYSVLLNHGACLTLLQGRRGGLLQVILRLILHKARQPRVFLSLRVWGLGVLVRVRPLSSMEKSMHGYSRCLKQENAQSITWIGQPETRFTFDHVACESVDQEMLFRMACLPMVENCLSGYNSCMFAYGQTGSGKTYTMLGEIDDLEVKPSQRRGLTPRIFEFLFARIQAEEESRRDERLKYNCKCSFLEIYNEQITDLLDPSSTNLLLREDVKQGVYVENLSEFEVRTVSDILKLLTQGSVNRKVAATNMNRQSSRSHSVFTCVIESRWEKDSTTNLRFARLNLVDLAGSERQKSSGAEGERLKEAANINKSLSTLGHDVTYDTQCDSGLAWWKFKTMIIANVSPSICCSAETLSTLKFAQRAKLIQNNAIVNEDSTGDVIALQHQIRLLKEELSLLKRQNVFRSLSFGSTGKDTTQVKDAACSENMHVTDQQQVDGLLGFESKDIIRMSTEQLNSLETTLAGALRREQMAETHIKKLEAKIEQLNCLVCQREEETRITKMMLRCREDKIQRMESILGDSLSQDTYLLEENRALCEEIQLLQAKVDKNPEITRFAMENIRLLDQLKRFQEFYQEGEREILLDKVSKLQEQLPHYLDGKSIRHNHPNVNGQPQLKNSLNELEECRCKLSSCLEDNKKLSRETHDLQLMLDNLKSTAQDKDDNVKNIKDPSEALTSEFGMLRGVKNGGESMHIISVMKHAEEVLDLQLQLDILKIILEEERSIRGEVEERTACLSRELELANEKLLFVSKQHGEATHELKEAKLVVEALESQQILTINEMEDLRKSNSHYLELLHEKEFEIMELKEQLSRQDLRDYPSDRLDEEMDEVRRQAEAETVEVIVCMQEELSILQQQVHNCHLKEIETNKVVMLLENELKELKGELNLLTKDNKELHGKLESKDGELRTLSDEWELLACEIAEIVADGLEALTDASDQLKHISTTFPHKKIWISEQVGRLIRIISEKEFLIEELSKCLEDANNKRSDAECMLKSLRGAVLVINEAHLQECNEKEKENFLLKSLLKEKTTTIAELEDKVKLAELHATKSSVCATAAFVIVNRFSELNVNNLNKLKCKNLQPCDSAEINQRKDALVKDQAASINEAEEKVLV